MIGGLRIIVSPDVGSRYEWTRKPRSRRKRIRKKWRKDRSNWRFVERPEFYQVADGTIIASRAGYQQLKAMTQAA